MQTLQVKLRVGMILRALTFTTVVVLLFWKMVILNLQQKVLMQQTKQLSIGSLSIQMLPFLKIQVKSQLNQLNQHLQLNLKNQNWQKCQLLKKNQFHQQNQNIKLYLSYQANQLNQKHLSYLRIQLRKKQKNQLLNGIRMLWLSRKMKNHSLSQNQNQSLNQSQNPIQNQNQNKSLSKKSQNQYYQILVQLVNHLWLTQPLLV